MNGIFHEGLGHKIFGGLLDMDLRTVCRCFCCAGGGSFSSLLILSGIVNITEMLLSFTVTLTQREEIFARAGGRVGKKC